MRFCSFVLPAVALVASVFHSVNAADDVALPWDGRGEDLTVATLTSKYLTHILTQRQSNANADPADWVTIDKAGRSPGYNDDTGVINIAVDNLSIFNGQTTFRRSELVQQVAAGDTTYFRTSFMKTEAFINKHAWQVIFPESHVFTMTIDATLATPMIYFYDSGYKSQWSTKFVVGTWYNFGIAISSSSMVLYASEGDDDLVKVATVSITSSVTNFEFHIGMLTLSNDGSQPSMVANKQDILSFNGVSAASSVTTTGASSGSSTTTTTTTATTAPSAASEASASSAASASTSTTTTTSSASEAAEASESSAASASSTETSESASPATTTASSTASEESEYSESDSASAATAPATTTATPTVTTATPTTTKESCNTRRTRRN